ncbi:BBE domain-containing protein [Microbispora rosea]
MNGGETAASAFDADTLARLREIKRRRDPDGVFRSNQPVLA